MANRKYTKEQSQEIAVTILNQLGGKRFSYMAGVRNMGFGDGSLSFRIGLNEKNITHVNIILEDDDTYKMVFMRDKKFEVEILNEISGVMANDLVRLFEEYTGLYTKL